METNKLKRFAVEARIKICRGVTAKLLSLGFNDKGEAAEFPVQLQGATLFRGEQLEEDFYPKWIALHEAISRHGIKEVCEEAAYTWFNRFMAIRILQMNGFIDRVLLFDDPAIRVPHIVSEARQGRLPQMVTGGRLRLRAIIADPNKTYEQFVLLITALCHATPVLYRCFGTINDYTELLLPDDILDEGGFIDMINHTEFISEEDYKTTELLGWLYQFYISERKDEVFASFKKGGKAEADDIPAATQIFTPNWIVKYMVENTLGRIYLDNNPDSDLAEKKPYLVERADGDKADVYTYSQLEDLKVLDPACGSGHILLEAFDLLYDLYLNEFYSREEAITAIFRHNLLGVDIDTRARQLAMFALLLKACQRDRSFLDGHCLPRVLDMANLMPERSDNLRDTLPHFFLGGTKENIDEVMECYQLIEQADTLGSIMKFPISESTRRIISESMERREKDNRKDFEGFFPGMRLILALTDKYAAVVANPPYMGASNMNKVLSIYVKKNYPNSKADLFSVFMEVAADRLSPNGKYGMINMQSWMFLSSFEKLRRSVLDNFQIDSMLHLGPRTFDELSGEVVQNTAFVIANHPATHSGTYFRLVDGKDCADKERMFRNANLITNSSNIVFRGVSQKNFEKIPGCPIGYNLSDNVINCISSNPNLADSECIFRIGLMTGDNKRFLRLWHEVDNSNIEYHCPSAEESELSDSQWYPINSGGSFRKWWGNQDTIANWLHNGKEMKEDAVLRNGGKHWSRYIVGVDQYFKPGISWNAISSGKICLRAFDDGMLIGHSSVCGFCPDNNYVMALLNSPVSLKLLEILSPTVNYGSTQVNKIPLIQRNNRQIDEIVGKNISISKSDWDAHETSWDFQENELLALSKGCESENKSSESKNNARGQKIEDLLNTYHEKWEVFFMQLHANEEELNHQFINIYGLQDELTPEVPLEEVTILQQGEITIE